MKLQVSLLSPNAVLPTYAHTHDAGMDLYALEEAAVIPGERKQIRTGIAVAVPNGYVGLVWDKSGLSHKFGLKTFGGVIDAGYRGEILVGIQNFGTETYTFAAGDKIAQMLIQAVEHPVIEIVETLDETNRGESGFGSTGK